MSFISFFTLYIYIYKCTAQRSSEFLTQAVTVRPGLRCEVWSCWSLWLENEGKPVEHPLRVCVFGACQWISPGLLQLCAGAADKSGPPCSPSDLQLVEESSESPQTGLCLYRGPVLQS